MYVCMYVSLCQNGGENRRQIEKNDKEAKSSVVSEKKGKTATVKFMLARLIHRDLKQRQKNGVNNNIVFNEGVGSYIYTQYQISVNS